VAEGNVPLPADGEHGFTAHQLVDLAFDAMFTRGFDDRKITSWNLGAERLYGWTREEALGHIAGELLCSVYPIPLEDIEEQLRQIGHWEGHIRQCRKDGSPVWVAARWGLQTDAAGDPHAILEINSDLTTHRESHERLERSEERFRLLVSAVKEYAIFMLDAEGVVTTWNAGAARIKGYTADEIIGRHFSVFYPPEDVATRKPDRALKIAARDGTYKEEGWRLRKDGTRFWASVVITALRDETGELRGYAKVTRDVTEKHAEEERLREHARQMAELEHAKTQFLDLAAHDLRNPLTLIRGYNSLLAAGSLPPERIPEIARMLEGRLEQIDLLVKQMLDMARLESDRLDLHVERIDLCHLTVDQLTKFRPLTSGHELAMTTDSVPTFVKADPTRIDTIVANLIDNAIKYSPAGGQVTCRVGTTDSFAFVSVRDQGVGIAPEHIPQLFRRFTRLPTDDNRRIPGTGLALYLCREIAHRHGGELLVTSTPGKGSEFTLLLPKEDSEPQTGDPALSR
jgi:PAS domain S-box-containing protein